jgi:FHA domain
VTANDVVRKLIPRVSAAGETTGDPGGGLQARRRRRAGGLGLGEELDAVFAAADEELLGYIRARINPEAGLAALIAPDNEKTGSGQAGSLPGYKPGIEAGRGKTRPRHVRVPLGSRRRKRWAAASAAAAAAVIGWWLVILGAAGSVPLATISLPVLAVLATACFMALRWLGIGAGHPWVRRMATRPWRDGRDVLNVALRRLPEVFMMMPGKALFAPAAVELLMNPADLSSLTELIDIEVVNSSATGCYEAAVAAYAAQLTGDLPAKVTVTGDPEIPAGRYRLRRDQRRTGTRPAGQLHPHGGDGSTRHDLAGVAAARTGLAILEEPVVSPPPLRLVTNGSSTETQVSGARAGRGWKAELRLPEDRTVSRVHAKFTFVRGQWWITSLGRNGLVLNGTPLAAEHVDAVQAGDSIRWGRQEGALMSRVEIGEEQACHAGTPW